MTDPTSRQDTIRSELASDADMQDLVRMFVDEMPERIAEMRRAWEQADAAMLRRLAHQMKGAAPGYGFTPLGDSARALESALKNAEANIAATQREFDELVGMCSRVAL